MGRYSDTASCSGSVGIFSVSGAPKSSLADVYDIDFTAGLLKVGSMRLTASFGP